MRVQEIQGFAIGLWLTKQVAQSWHSTSCQCAETFSYVGCQLLEFPCCSKARIYATTLNCECPLSKFHNSTHSRLELANGDRDLANTARENGLFPWRHQGSPGTRVDLSSVAFYDIHLRTISHSTQFDIQYNEFENKNCQHYCQSRRMPMK